MAETISFPLDLIEKSSGVSFDIGGSVTKVIYRSKNVYKDGKLINRKPDQTEGPLHLESLARANLDTLLDFIKENCDLHFCGPDRILCATGVGGNFFKDRIEQELNVRMENVNEFDCNWTAVSTLCSTKSRDELFIPIREKAIQEAMRFTDSMGEMEKFMEENTVSEMEARIPGSVPLSPDKPERDEHFPFILVTCGSVFGACIIHGCGGDKTYEMTDITPVGGRFFLGLSSILTGIKSFDELINLIRTSDGKTADLYVKDLIDPEAPKDMYNSMPEDMLIFNMGKALRDPEGMTKGDMAQSVLTVVCTHLTMWASLLSEVLGYKRIYFNGSFVDLDCVQDILTRELCMRNLMKKPEDAMDFQFFRNSAHIGASGAMFAHCTDA